MKVSDYIVSFFEKFGIKDVFMISGGLAMHLNDSFGKSKKIRYYCNFHEQASAMAAEGYARYNNNLAVCVVTGGPGGSNCVTGVVGQWQDSVPVLYLSGQVKQELLCEKGMRQLGEQELSIIPIISSITKYAVQITDPKTIRYHLEKAVYLALSGRPGPVWLDIPLDIQAAEINEKEIVGYEREAVLSDSKADIEEKIKKSIEYLKESKRPVILVGRGARIANALDAVHRISRKYTIPVLPAWCSNDTVYKTFPNYFGNPGLTCDRAANFIIQNADVVLSLGSRLNLKTVSFNYKTFAREAILIAVDIDKYELSKKTIHPDIAIWANVKDVVDPLEKYMHGFAANKWYPWKETCRQWKKRYDKHLPAYQKKGNVYVNPYHFVSAFSEESKNIKSIVSCNSVAAVSSLLMIDLWKGQRFIINSGCGAMGYDLPAAIGVTIASGRKDTALFVGDGSIMFNIQELQTIAYYKLPIKIFIFNNKGYLSIRNTQKTFFGGHIVAADKNSGVACPDFKKIAKAFALPYFEIRNHKKMNAAIRNILQKKGPVICDLHMSYDLELIPRVVSKMFSDGKMYSLPMEDLYPFLDREEFRKNMLIKPILYE